MAPNPPIAIRLGFLGALALVPAESESRQAGAAARARDPEEDWIRRAKGGDSEAFRRLVDRYRDRAFETALRIVGSPEEAEEVAQDAFVRCWRFLHGFRGESRFSTWLYRIVARQALDVAKRLAKRREQVAESARIEAFPAAPGTPRSHLLRLERILGKLTPIQRAVVTLFYLRDETVEETGRILGLPEGTVKSHLHRSRSILRKAWMLQERNDGLRRL
jgi:RNA polymerase sigma-70 factor (ECF subfamily)